MGSGEIIGLVFDGAAWGVLVVSMFALPRIGDNRLWSWLSAANVLVAAGRILFSYPETPALAWTALGAWTGWFLFHTEMVRRESLK